MEYGAIDLHLRRSQIRIVGRTGRWCRRAGVRRRARIHAAVWATGADAHSDGK